MTQLSKYEIIKDYVLEDRNRFSLAKDIYDNFDNIKKSLQGKIYSLLEQEIVSGGIPKANIHPYYGYLYANRQFIDIKYSESLKIQIQFSNYFKTPQLNISELNDDLTKKIIEEMKEAEVQNKIVYIKLSDYKFIKTSTMLELYDLCHDEELKKELIENFNDYVLEPSKIIWKIFNDFNKN